MDIKLWIIVQIAIDIIMVAVLVWVISSNRRQKGSEPEEAPDMGRPEALLAEIKEITRHLEENLEQKRELSRRLLGRMDETLARAEERYQQFSRLLDQADRVSKGDNYSEARERDKSGSIRELLDQGMTKNEVARHLGISVGEIDLFLKLGKTEAGRDA